MENFKFTRIYDLQSHKVYGNAYIEYGLVKVFDTTENKFVPFPSDRAVDLGLGLKKYYMAAFPDDEMGADINDNVYFYDLLDGLRYGVDVYSIIGENADSVIRERLFQKLANMIKVDYDHIYYMWLQRI